MKAFVTGGTGFIGECLVRRLVERGDQVWALARSSTSIEMLSALGATPVEGDITDPASLQSEVVTEALKGCDVLFHLAAWYKIGAKNMAQAEKINVEGTRNMLTRGFELGVPRLVYTSTVAVYGDTRGRLVTEADKPPAGPLLTEYDRTKHKAHVEAALPLIEQGAPLIILMPGAVYGPDDHSLVGELMRRFYLGQFPIFPAPDMMLCWSHVDDIVEGHILAAEKGRPGESYFLTGPAVRMGDMVRVWSAVLKRPGPLLQVPAPLVKPFTPLMDMLNPAVNLPEMFSHDAMLLLDASYVASSEKARDELGWKLRPLREGMRQTFEWIAANYGAERQAYAPLRQAAGLAIGAAAGIAVFLISQRNRK